MYKIYTAFLLVISFIQISTESFGQQLTYSSDNATLKSIFGEITRQTGYDVVYALNNLNEEKKVSVTFEKAPLKQVMDVCLEGLPVTYITQDKTILIKRGTPLSDHKGKDDNINEPPVRQVTVRGKITNTHGEPIPGVTITVKGTSMGASTDAEGNYELTAVPEGAVLLFSFLGYQSREENVNGRQLINMVLEEDIAGLDEVVVVGYGTQKKANIIGSVATISNEELLSAPVPNISNALAGRMSGVLVQQRSGEPGANSANILIRGKSTLGNNTPLIVVDGIQGRDINSLNAADIESISILKDASAAIYGARAANGVILVTTKSGQSNTAPTLNYRFYAGLKSPSALPEMTNSWEYAEMIREVETYRGIDESNMTFQEEDIEKFKSGNYPWTHPNTKWYDEALARNSSTQSHDFSINGGSSTVSYYVSFGSLKENSIYTDSEAGFDRLNLKGNINVIVNDYIDVGLDIMGVKEDKINSTKSSENIFTSIIRNYPYKHAVFPGTDKPGPDIEYGDQPVVTSSLAPGFDNEIEYRSINTFHSRFRVPFVENLVLNASYSFDKYFSKRKFFEKPYTLYDFDIPGYIASGKTGAENGEDFLIPYRAGTAAEPRLTDSYSDSHDRSLNLKLSYEYSFNDKHHLDAFVAYENGKSEGQGISAFRRFFNSDQLPYLFAGGDEEKDNSGWATIDARANIISRINYDYEGKYLFQLGFRRDGSVRFSEENGRWGNFPSVLAGWRISEHDWFKNKFGVINEFKIKASWAKMGNDLVPPFQYLSSFEFGNGTIFGSGQYSPALYQSGIPNPNITWEVANISNLGIESYFFNYRLNLEVDIFYQRRNNILIKRNASVPRFTGLKLPDENFGIVDSRGIEASLGYQNNGADFSYAISSNFSFSRNKVIEFDEPARNVPWQVLTGLPQGATLLYKSAGIFRDEDHVKSLPHVAGARPGDIIIADIDGNGEITPDDQILRPLTADPEIMFGLNGSISYRNITLSFLIQGVENAIRNIYTTSNQGRSGNYFRYDAIDRWTPTNMDAQKPRAFDRVDEYWRQTYLTDYNFHPLGYARFKNLQLSYSIPESIAESLKTKQIAVYLSGQNLFLIYNKNKVFDPEVSNAQTYPLMRTFAIGASITL